MNKELLVSLEVNCNDKKYVLSFPYPNSFKDVYQSLQMFSDELINWEKEILAQEQERKEKEGASQPEAPAL